MTRIQDNYTGKDGQRWYGTGIEDWRPKVSTTQKHILCENAAASRLTSCAYGNQKDSNNISGPVMPLYGQLMMVHRERFWWKRAWPMKGRCKHVVLECGCSKCFEFPLRFFWFLMVFAKLFRLDFCACMICMMVRRKHGCPQNAPQLQDRWKSLSHPVAIWRNDWTAGVADFTKANVVSSIWARPAVEICLAPTQAAHFSSRPCQVQRFQKKS